MLIYVIVLALACVLFAATVLYMRKDYAQSKIYLDANKALGEVTTVLDTKYVDFYGPVFRRKYSSVLIKFKVDGRYRVCLMSTQGWCEHVGRLHCVHYYTDENNTLRTYDDISVRRYIEMRNILILSISVFLVMVVLKCFDLM